MRTEITNIYKFEELSNETQQKVIEDNRAINTDGTEWYEQLFEVFKEELTQKGFSEIEIYFSGFWSQGDGLCFDADIDTTKFLPKRIKNLECDINILKNNYATRYCHEKTRYIDYDIYHEYNGDNINNVEKIVEKVTEGIQDLYITLCKDFYNRLEKFYVELTSDEYIKDTIIVNEYEFLSNGERY